MLTATLRAPVTNDQVHLYDYPEFILWAFSGCKFYCRYDLSVLPYSRQQLIFKAALRANPRDRHGTRRAVAVALINMAKEFGHRPAVADLTISDKALKRLAYGVG